MLDHVLDRRHGRDISLIATLRAQQIHHILGRVHVGIGYITIFIRVGMSGLVALLSFARVFDDVGHFYARDPVRSSRLENRGKRRSLGRALKYRVLSPVGPALRRRVVSEFARFCTRSSARVRCAAIPDALTESTENKLIRIDLL